MDRVDVLLTCDRTLMSNHHGKEFLGFGTTVPPNRFPEWLFRYLFFPRIKSINGSERDIIDLVQKALNGESLPQYIQKLPNEAPSLEEIPEIKRDVFLKSFYVLFIKNYSVAEKEKKVLE